MDLDIDNYNNNEILELLAIAPAGCNHERLLDKVEDAIREVEEGTVSNSDQLVRFFRECYLRIAVAKGYEVTKEIRQTLGLPVLPSVEDRPESQIMQRQPITAPVVYPGSLPAQEPMVYSINTVPSEYARGLNDPLKRDTVKHTLILNSKFRQNLTDASRARSQGDMIRMRTYCSTTNYKMKNVRETIYQGPACDVSNIESNADRGLTTDYSVELDDPYENVVSLRLAGLEMANTRYNVSGIQGTNEFQAMAAIYDETTGTWVPTSAPEWKTVTLLDGTYGVLELVAEIEARIGAIFTAVPGGRQPNQMEALFEMPTNKVNFRVRGPPLSPPLPPLAAGLHYAISLDFRISENPGRPIYMNLGWMLGYRKARYDYLTDYVGNAAGTLPVLKPYEKQPCDPRATLMQQIPGFNPIAAPNLAGAAFYLLEVEDYNNNNPIVVSYNCTSEFSFNVRNIIAKIPNTVGFENVIFEDSSDRIWKTRRYFGPVRIKKLTIRLLDDNGRPVDLNDGDFCVTLEIETLNMPYKNMVR